MRDRPRHRLPLAQRGHRRAVTVAECVNRRQTSKIVRRPQRDIARLTFPNLGRDFVVLRSSQRRTAMSSLMDAAGADRIPGGDKC